MSDTTTRTTEGDPVAVLSATTGARSTGTTSARAVRTPAGRATTIPLHYLANNLNPKFKTVLCTHYTATGDCPYRLSCKFAHGEAELRSLTDSAHAWDLLGVTRRGTAPARPLASAPTASLATPPATPGALPPAPAAAAQPQAPAQPAVQVHVRFTNGSEAPVELLWHRVSIDGQHVTRHINTIVARRSHSVRSFAGHTFSMRQQGADEVRRWTLSSDLRQQYMLNAADVNQPSPSPPSPSPPSPSPPPPSPSLSPPSQPSPVQPAPEHPPSSPSSPSAFICSITQDVMTDPVVCSDGHSYERAAIECWLATHNTSPNTNLPLVSGVTLSYPIDRSVNCDNSCALPCYCAAQADPRLIPNIALRASIEQWQSSS